MQWTYSQCISAEKWAVVETSYGAQLVEEWKAAVAEQGNTPAGEPTTHVVPCWFGENNEFVEVPPVAGMPPATLRIDITGEVNESVPDPDPELP